MNEFPAELKEKPKAFVGVVGLDLDNTNHKAVWDTLSRPQEYSPIFFQMITPDHVFPSPKPKKQFYERYVPRGILKKEWVNKHLHVIPAVVAIFFELDLVNTSEWSEKKSSCVDVIQKIRNALTNRDTRMALILLQKESSLPPGDDVIVSERAATLCNMANINNKAFYMLPCSDHLRQYIIRIEVALLELAQSYYTNAAKVVKNHKDFLNETNHMVLYVRHPFKMAFYHELKQDLSSALKLYLQAYGQVFRMRFSDANLHEIKTVAGIINYKICHLQFRNNIPRDAIIQYKKHMDAFKNLVSPAELCFEHWSWLSLQAELFGEIFKEAIQLGLEAVQTQHPGIYYDQAVQFTYQRKNQALILCSNATVLPSPNPLSEAEHVDYYGQRPWRGNRHTMEISDQSLEKQGIMALQYMEHLVNHSEIIISQLNNGIAQYKKYNCPRTTKKLSVLMAQEYTALNDYNKALTILMGVLWQYRLDKWWVILTDVVQKAFQLSIRTTSCIEYVGLGLELLNEKCLLAEDMKIKILSDLKAISKGDVPTLYEESHHWDAGKVPTSVTVDITNYLSCIQCKAKFQTSRVCADSNGVIDVYLWYDGPDTLELSKLTVCLNSSQYNVITCTDAMTLKSKEFCVKSLEFVPSPQDVGREVQVTSVSVDIGKVINLKWMGGSSSQVTNDTTVPRLIVMGLAKDDPNYKFQSVEACCNVLIAPRSSQLTVDIVHFAPALVGEWYPITINVENTEDVAICDIILDFNLSHLSEKNMEQSTFLAEKLGDDDSIQTGKLHHVNLGRMEPKESKKTIFYMKATSEGLRNYLFRIFYDINVSTGDSSDFVCHCNKELFFDVQAVHPFSISDNKLSLVLDPIVIPATMEPFILMCNVDCLSPWPLILQNSNIQFASSDYRLADEKDVSQLSNVDIKNGEKATECFCILADPYQKPKTGSGDLPTFDIYWTRKDMPDIPPACTSVPVLLPPPTSALMFVELDMPSNGWVRTPLHVKYFLHNRGQKILDLKVSIEQNESFMISGNKTTRLRILPSSHQKLTYNLYPISAGQVPLPKLKLNAISGDEDSNSQDLILESTLNRLLPSHIFIMPQSKKTFQFFR